MMEEEAFHAFLCGLHPHLQERIGPHVQGDLEAAIAMAQHLEVYYGGGGAMASGSEKGSKKYKNQNQKKGNMAQVEGSSSGGGPSRWSKWSRNNNRRRARVARALVGKRPKGKDGSMCNAKIVAEIISCATARNGRKSRRNSVLPREIEGPAPSPIQTGHWDGTLDH